MLISNKLFLALAFLGSSAAVQAAEGNADISRIDYGKSSEKTDRSGGVRRGLSGSSANALGTWGQSLSQQHIDHAYCLSFENLSATYNGVKVRQENQLGSYDVSQPLASTSKLFDVSARQASAQQASLSLSQGQNSYLPNHRVL
ncbi:hypothetical protein [Pseudomonas huanghezhanensis]|uniref:hypothetical protein n=1 Tax=Pseudomonas huanghezhanensis TaxID=3002903 RepID=UPI0022854828|nr:hypothetical protein [Pseudomonas sp. BSw22131]